MEASHKKIFNCRKFISFGLFLTFAVLVITAVVIQIFEALENDFLIHFFTVTHIFSGLIFTVLSVLHIKKNIRSMKTYLKTGQLTAGREAIYVVLITVAAVLAGFLFAYFIID